MGRAILTLIVALCEEYIKKIKDFLSTPLSYQDCGDGSCTEGCKPDACTQDRIHQVLLVERGAREIQTRLGSRVSPWP